jgi:hypothetical protein
MEDIFNRNRKQPDKEFSRQLYQKINRQEITVTNKNTKWKFALAAFAAAIGLTTVFTVPAVGAMAQNFLNMFRVKRITAVTIDPARLEALRNNRADMKALLGDVVEQVKQPSEPQAVADANAASQLAGMTVKLPAQAPLDSTSKIVVRDESEARITIDTEKGNALLALAGVDQTLPASANGAKITIKTFPAVTTEYSTPRGNIEVIQTRSPEVTLPDGVSMAQLGEMMLRIGGMSADDAASFSQKVDWNSTLVIPIPANAATYKEVTIRGNNGILIESQRERGRGRESVLMWSEGDIVYAIASTFQASDIFALAETLQ